MPTFEEYSECCPNCSAELNGSFCAECGQRQLDLDRPFRELVAEALSTFFAFDTRLTRTVRTLIRRPGFLTREFLDGRRARYAHPFKLYFAFSLVFFLVFSFSDYTIIHANEPGIISITNIDDEAVNDADGVESVVGQDFTVATDAVSEDRVSSFFEQLEELAANDPTGFDRLFIDRLSQSLIVLVPVVALLMQLLYWKPRYVTHLVFSLHVHCFSFIALVVGALIDGGVGIAGFDSGGIGNSVATLALVVYLFLALRRVYGQGRLITTGKFLVLLVGYALALVLTMLGTLVITVALL